MLARAAGASEQCGQHFRGLQHGGQGQRVWGKMWHGQHAAEGRIHEAGAAKNEAQRRRQQRVMYRCRMS